MKKFQGSSVPKPSVKITTPTTPPLWRQNTFTRRTHTFHLGSGPSTDRSAGGLVFFSFLILKLQS